MKKVFLILGALMLSIAANAQFGINVGYLNNTFLRFDDAGNRTFDSFNGVSVGATYTIDLEVVELTPGIFWNSTTKHDVQVNLQGRNYTGNWNQQYIDVPVVVSYTFNKGGFWKPYLCVGPVFQFGIANKVKGDVYSLDLYREDDGSLAPGGAFTRFNIQAGPGLGLIIGDHFRISAMYNFGLMRRTKNEAGDKPYRNNMLFIGGAVLF